MIAVAPSTVALPVGALAVVASAVAGAAVVEVVLPAVLEAVRVLRSWVAPLLASLPSCVALISVQ